MRFQVDSGRIYITLGFFLLGLYAGRRRLFQQLTENRRWFRRLTRFSGFSVLGITAIGLGLFLGVWPLLATTKMGRAAFHDVI